MGIYCFFPTKPYHHHQKWREKSRVGWTLLVLTKILFLLIVPNYLLLSSIVLNVPYGLFLSLTFRYNPIFSPIIPHYALAFPIITYHYCPLFSSFSLIFPNSPLFSAIIPDCPTFLPYSPWFSLLIIFSLLLSWF